MYDVPVSVKNALKDGRMKKNYSFEVEFEDWAAAGSFKTIDSLTDNPTQDEKYIINRPYNFKFVLVDEISTYYTFYYRNVGASNWTSKAPASGERNTWYLRSTHQTEVVIVRGATSNASQVSVAKYIGTLTIENDNLVAESVNIDERMCSGDTIKFGLCEGSSLEFQYFDFPNITGKRIEAFIHVEYEPEEWHQIPLGFFNVKSCSRQASTGIMKVTAYNKLQSDYLDANANELVKEIVAEGEVGVAGTATVDTILMKLLNDYAIEPKFNKASYTVGSGTNWAVVQGSGLYYRTPSDGVVYVACGNIYIDVSDLNPNGAYRLWVDRSKVKDALLEAMNDFVGASALVRNPQYTTDYNRLEDYVYSDGTGNLHPVSFSIPRAVITLTTGDVVAIDFVGDDDIVVSDYVIKKYTYPNWEILIEVPLTFIYKETQVETAWDAWQNLPSATRERIIQRWNTFLNNPQNFRIEERDSNALGSVEITTSIAETLPDVTLRELQSSVYELSCQYGQLDRTTDLFEGVELNHSRLYPAETLYPSNSLYPAGAALSATKSMYSKLWADEGNIHKWKYLIITYKGLNENNEEVEKTLQRTVNNDGTDNYNMSDNWLFRNLVWTAEQIGEYADAMVLKMRDITWFPFEMWCAGLPYLETGDEIEIPMGDQSYTSYILQRQLKGIQNLEDTYVNGTLDIF